VAVVDGPQFDTTYLEALGDVAGRVLVVDDIADRPAYPVGFLLNQNAHADRSEYPADATCRFLLGTRYVLLRREFVAAPPPRTTPSVASRLLVTFGGADPTGATVKTIEALRHLPEAIRGASQVRVIVGAANQDGARIDAAVADPELGFRAVVARASADMPAEMAWADLAITSGGSTVWELARAGCPALVVETVPVERRLVSGLERVGLFGYLGPASDLDPRKMADEIAAKAEDVAWRGKMTALGMDLIDGAGARRVVDALADAHPTRRELT
jgi:spore coat polysaccharide biosynthesis predicted glycosyltransferase SpsG